MCRDNKSHGFRILITSEFVIYLLSLYLYDMTPIISFTNPDTFTYFHIYSKYLFLSVFAKRKAGLQLPPSLPVSPMTSCGNPQCSFLTLIQVYMI